MWSDELPRQFTLPDEVALWDDQEYFAFLQHHQLGYQAILADLKARGLQSSEDYQHYTAQFHAVESCLAHDFNRRYHQG